MKNNTRIYTVSEITHNIKSILENQLSELWVSGEVSNLTAHQSGHTYFTLKDELSQLHAVLFKSQRMQIEVPVELKDGLHIFVFGKITVYEKGGKYQIRVTKWEPKGIGALQIAFDALKNKLYKEGLFDERHKKPIPILPQVVGVVTSPTGAAIMDIINVIEHRYSNMSILLFPVRVQGQGAAEEITNAIDEMNKLPDIDVIIVGRGGGSLEDLWAFNEECVARAIYRSSIPIISAVGHEIDYTISDFVADMRAPTPSAAAMLVVGKKTEFVEKIDFLKSKLWTSFNICIQDLKNRLFQARSSYVFKEPENTLRQYSQRIDELTHRLSSEISHFHEIQTHIFSNVRNRLQSLNPTAILSRGYSITTLCRTNRIVTNPKVLKRNDELETQVAKGRFKSGYKGSV